MTSEPTDNSRYAPPQLNGFRDFPVLYDKGKKLVMTWLGRMENYPEPCMTAAWRPSILIVSYGKCVLLAKET